MRRLAVAEGSDLLWVATSDVAVSAWPVDPRLPEVFTKHFYHLSITSMRKMHNLCFLVFEGSMFAYSEP